MGRVWTPRWLLVHAGVVVLVAGFLALGWWQLTRAASGNLLSYGYALEWPAFAGFLIWVWVKEMRKVLRGEADAAPPAAAVPDNAVVPEKKAPALAGRTTRQRPRSGPAYDDSGDDELSAYNHYLAWLNANPHANPADYPGPARSEEKK